MTKESASHDRLSGSGKPDSCPNICVYNKTCHRVRLADPVLLCESGGIGRRTRLRIWRRKAWGFESPLSHQLSSSKTKPENAEEARQQRFLGGLPRHPRGNCGGAQKYPINVTTQNSSATSAFQDFAFSFCFLLSSCIFAICLPNQTLPPCNHSCHRRSLTGRHSACS